MGGSFMKIVLTVNELKKIYKVCGSCLNPKHEKEALQQIYVEVKDGILQAGATDSYSFAETTIPISSQDSGAFLLPVVQVPKTADTVTISVGTDILTFIFSNGVSYIECNYPVSEYPSIIQMRRNFSRTSHSYAVAIDPKLLLRALKGLCEKNEAVILRFGKVTEPIYLDMFIPGRKLSICDHKRALVFPVRLNYDEAMKGLQDRKFL